MKTHLLLLITGFIFINLIVDAQQDEQKKLKVAVLDFSGSEGVSLQDASTLSDRFRSMLVQVNSLIVLDRSIMKNILSEQGFQQSGCTTTECAVEVGKLLNVQKMINGRIGKLGNTYTIDISFIDIKTGKIERSFMKNYKGAIDGLLEVIQSIVTEIGNIASETDRTKASDQNRCALSIKTDPPDARILINNKLIGKTPFKRMVRRGIYIDIKLQKENYLDWLRSYSTDQDINIDVKLEYTNAYKQELLQKAKKTGSGKETIAASKKGGGNTFLWIAGIAAVGGGVTYYILSKKNEEKVQKDIFPPAPDRPVK